METFWAAVKKYWAYVALALGVIAGVLFFNCERVDFADQVKKIQDAHDEEIKKILAAREEEHRQHAVNEKKLQDTLAAVQKQYDDAKKDLDAKKRKEIEDIVRQYSDDPAGLAHKLSEAAGFTVILPV